MSVVNALARAEFITMPVPIAANGGIGPVTNDPLMFGAATSVGLSGLAQTSYMPPTGIPTGSISVAFIGAEFLSVNANNGASPPSGVAINPGDKVYADGGTLDTVTGCLYGFVLDANSSGTRYYGNALDAIPAGQTATIRVRLKVTG
jgi:hypothetical protein